MKYEQFQDGVWITPIRKRFKIICCDCGLAHDIDFQVKKGKIQFRIKRNNHSTALIRRNKVKVK